MAKRINWCLIGIPDHQGVLHVGGRIGAAEGPSAFRRIWKRLSGAQPLNSHLTTDVDTGPFTQDVEENLRIAAESIAQEHKKAGLSIVVGGGHDHGYSHLLGLRLALPKNKRLGCINIDAHLDVRKPEPLITSGSPFFLALERQTLHPSRFIEFGIQDQCNSTALWDYVQKKKVSVIRWNEIRKTQASKKFQVALKKLATRSDAIAISLDLDAAAQAFAPGVSAPQSEGFSANDLGEICAIAGAHQKVISLGLFELNPKLDQDDATARLAATLAYRFIAARIGI